MADNEETDSNEQNVYGNEGREALMDDGEISAEEEAFMAGYDETEKEKEDSTEEAYDKAFATRRTKKRQSRKDDEDEDEEDDF